MNVKVVDGIQFFDKELECLNKYEFEYVHDPKKKMTASSLVTYLFLKASIMTGETACSLKLSTKILAASFSPWLMASSTAPSSPVTMTKNLPGQMVLQ